MASSKLIGTAPDQVPSNADLGELAFQNKESVEFTGGKGGLSSLDLTAIAASKNVSATDIFVYDTSKDSDGGAWRNRCQNTSWYNETLNTDTRGSRREFPSVAVIVVTTSSLTIYDGDSPDLPMWMVTYADFAKLTTLFNSVSALNGKVCAGSNGGVNYTGVFMLDFIPDEMFGIRIYSYSANHIFRSGIVRRNTTDNWQQVAIPRILQSGGLISELVNDVAMTVLPNAPIDAATGLPIPTIAVATNGGVSIIHNNGSVINAFYSGYGQCTKVFFTAFGGLQMHGGGGIAYRAWGLNSIPMVTTNSFDYKLDDAGWASTQLNRNGGNGNSQLYPCRPTSDGFATREVAGVSTSDKLIVVSQNTTAFGYSLQRYVTTKYNTGWMPGDIKGAWLSDTTQETVVGAELITNGTFSSDVSGWTPSGAGRFTWSSGTMKVERLDGTYNTGNPTQTINTIPGKRYTITFTLTAANGQAILNVYSATGSTLLDFRRTSLATYQAGFTATTSTTTILFGCDWNNTYFNVDNVTCRLADADRSVGATDLQVYGSITKTPVATSADLVAYSGFSASNYLYQPYNSAFNVGSGDFCIIGWARSDDITNSTQTLFSLSDGSSYINIGRTTSSGAAYVNSLYFGISGSGGTYGGYTNGVPNTLMSKGVWNQIVVLRNNGSTRTYFNGVQTSIDQTTYGTFVTANSVLKLGAGFTVTGYEMSMALWRFSATAPSADQIAKMYNDEKVLFQDNAKATLYGTSDAVTALAYDQDTKQLHVGTSSGRSVFQGLRRVDNTTTSVSTSISAANGLVAEN